MWNTNAGCCWRIMKKSRKLKQYIFICQGKDCLKNGARELCKDLDRALKSNPVRPTCELIKTKCMDHCKDAPSVVFDNTWYGKVTEPDLMKLIRRKKAVK